MVLEVVEGGEAVEEQVEEQEILPEKELIRIGIRPAKQIITGRAGTIKRWQGQGHHQSRCLFLSIHMLVDGVQYYVPCSSITYEVYGACKNIIA